MKKFLTFLVLLFLCSNGNPFAQTYMNETIEVSNYDCFSAYKLCTKVVGYYSLDNGNDPEDCELTPVYFSFRSTVNLQNELYVRVYTENVALYGPFPTESFSNCGLIASNQANVVQKNFVDAIDGFLYFDLQEGYYILALLPTQCNSEFKIGTGRSSTLGLGCKETIDCNSCITTFSPTPGKYVVSAWVKELNTPATQTSYLNSKIRVSFDNSSVSYDVLPSGKIVDGWQRMEAIVEVPTEATNIHLNLETTANGNAVFDDIRFFPNDGSMMSYVYDPISLKLVAELDERNYATKYEYDEEGQLIRVKKETEKGVMTIQENRNNTVKKP